MKLGKIIGITLSIIIGLLVMMYLFVILITPSSKGLRLSKEMIQYMNMNALLRIYL